jgi:xanthine dehydrogenase accessory factor
MVAQAAMESLAERRARIVEVDLTDEIFGAGMPCGGHMRVFVEPCHPNPVLWLLGSGALVEYLCQLASDLDFDVIVIDRNADIENYPRAIRVIDDDDRYQQLLPGPTDLVVIATHHKGDHLALHQLMPSEVDYIGVVASRKRAGLILNRLRSEGITEVQLARIRAPAGIMIESETPREIAVSIVAELIRQVRSRRTGFRSNA